MLDALKNNLPINWELASNPVNWAIILLMVVIGGMAISLIFTKGTAND